MHHDGAKEKNTMAGIRPSTLALPVALLAVVAGAGAWSWLPRLAESTPASPSAADQPAAAKTPAPSAAASDPADTIRFGLRAPKPKTPGSIRLANYNVENLFDDKDDPALTGQYEDIDDRKPDEQLKALADTLRALDADIVALQEIESLDALLWFRDAWIKDLGYAHVASIDAGDERGIEQAVLSRFPLQNVKNWPGTPIPGVHPDDARDATPGEALKLHRSPLRADVVTPGGTITLFVIHHKSGSRSAYWREAEAKKILEFIHAEEKADPARPIALVGDFNSTPDQPTVQTYLTGGLTDLFADRVTGDSPKASQWITHSSGRTIDLILANDDFENLVIPESRFILGTPARPAGADWRTTPPPPNYISDHYPVVVDLRLPPPAEVNARQNQDSVKDPKDGSGSAPGGTTP
jgi:endonuclease/exonuclease/phosphatase family metal-dependent hydrolase